jgi:hypothetical protein
MAENIIVGTRVRVQTIEGLFTGTVIKVRDAKLLELNPPALPNALESNIKELILHNDVPVFYHDLHKIVTLYEVELDDATNYRGSIRNGNIATQIYKFITPIE